MTQAFTRQLLQEAEEAIRHCRRHQDRQRATIEKRERTGHDATQPRALLKTLHQVQVEHEANRDRLAEELAKSS